MVQLYGRSGGESVVNSIVAGSQSQPAIARLASGNFVIVWVSQTAPGSSDWEIRGQLYDADGDRIGGEFLASPSTGVRGEPRVAALSTGGFVVSWSYDVHDGTGADPANLFAYRLRAQLFDSAAAKVGGELAIGPSTGDHFDSQLTGLPGGGFAVTWTWDAGNATLTDYNAVGQMFDSAGAPAGAQFSLAAGTVGLQYNSAVAALPGGGFVAAWTDTVAAAMGDTAAPAVKAQLFDSAGAKVGVEFLVNTTTAGAQYSPSIAVLNGGFVVIWTDNSRTGGDDSGQATKGQIFNFAGGKVGGEFLVNTTTQGDQFVSSLSALPGGGFVAAWRDGPFDDADIKAQVFDSAGARVGAEFLVNSVVAGHQNGPAILGLAGGGFAAAWTDQGGSDGDGNGVKAQIFAPWAGAPTDLSLSVTEVEETAIENVAVGTLSTVGAANSGFTYAIVGDSSGGAFRIEGNRLVVDDNAKLNFEVAPEVAVTIRTTDANGQSYDETFTLDVLDVGYERRYSAGDEFQVNLNEPGIEAGSQLVPLTGGGFALIWQQYDSSDPAPNKQVMRFYEADGTPRSTEHVIAETWLLGLTATPLINGGLLIARAAYHEPEGVFSIKAQAYDIDANAVGPEITVGSSQSGFPHSPTAIELSSGEYMISWATPGGEIHAQRVTPEGVAVGGELTLTTFWESVPISLVATPPSGFVAAWVEPRQSEDDPFFVRAQMYNHEDGLTGTSVSIPVSAMDISDVTIIALPDGGYMLGWVETLGESEGILLQAVMAQPIDFEGKLIGGPLLLTAFAAEADFGEVSFAAHPDQGFVVLWPMIDLSGDTVTHGWVGSLFNEEGAPIGSAFQATELGFAGVAAVLADGSIATSWSASDSDDSGVFARVYRPADEPFDDVTDDVLVGDSGPNSLDGAGGDDQLFGLEGDDVLIGGPGNDRLDGGSGADTMTGGPGNDVYIVDSAGDGVAENPGEGTDEIHTDLAVFSLAGLPNVENLLGTSTGNLRLTGNAADNAIYGNVGNDFIFLQAGGKDSAYGGDGNDVVLFGASMSWTDFIDGGAGLDQLALQGHYVGGSALIFGGGVVSIENIAILPGDDTRFGDPGTNFYDYKITLQDSMVAEGVQLVVDANRLRPGEDLIFDGSAELDGSFFIYGGGGTDVLFGGARNDVFLFGAWGQWNPADVVVGGAGTDQLALRGNYALTFGAGQLIGIENIGLLSAHDTRFGALGSSYSYDLTLVDGNVAAGVQMTVDGAKLRIAEYFRFDGSAELDGSFRVFGGLVDDTITASRNNDFLQGNGGLDILTGGLGADVFRYLATSDSTGAAADRILDFAPGTDKIDLSRIDADTNAAGDQAFRWIGSTAFTGGGASSAGELRAWQSGPSWFVEGDTDGNGAADFRIDLTLAGPTPLGAGDFVL